MNFGTLLCCCGTHEKIHGLSQKIQAMYFKIAEFNLQMQQNSD